MSNEGILRILNLRKMDLQEKMDYLLEVNTQHPRHLEETVNEYANGKIDQIRSEIEFIDKILAL